MRIHNLYVWFIGKERTPGVGTKNDMQAAHRQAVEGRLSFQHKYVINFDEACEWLDKYAGGDKDDYVRANDHEKLVMAHLKSREEAEDTGEELPAA